MAGVGHHLDWETKRKAEQSKTRGRKKAGKRGKVEEEVKVEKPPTFFDLAPLKKAIETLLVCQEQDRANIRRQVKKAKDRIKAEVFSTPVEVENEEPQMQDISVRGLGEAFQNANIPLSVENDSIQGLIKVFTS